MRHLLALLLLSATTAHASPGLEALAIYRCDADYIVSHAVANCKARYPQLAANADAALEKWRARYSAAAGQAKAECQATIQEMVAAEGKGQADKARARMTEVQAEMLKQSAARVSEKGEAFCTESLQRISEQEDRALELEFK